MSCNSCNNCNQEYKNTCNCNFVGCGNISISREENDINICSPEIFVTSPDDSINVNRVVGENSVTYEIEKDCCDDKYVVACENDNKPGVLFNDKLIVDTTGPLTYNLVNCPGDAYVEIGFDVTKLNAPDKKVAVNASCQGKYLGESMVVIEGEGVDNIFSYDEIPGCQLALRVNPRKLFIADLYLSTEATQTAPEGDTFIVSSASRWSFDTTINSAITTVQGTRGVTIPRDGWYQISMQGSCVVNNIHTIRHQVCINDSNLTPLLDFRVEGAWRKDQDGNDLIDTQDELNTGLSMVVHSDNVMNDGKELPIGYSLRGHGFAGTRVKYLTQGTTLMFVTKTNTITKMSEDYFPQTAHTIRYTTNNTDASTNGGRGAGSGRSVVELPEYSLSN